MRTKFKLGQMLETEEEFGKVTAIRITDKGAEYVINEGEDESIIPEDAVVDVYRKVTARKTKTLRATKGESKRSRAEAKAA